MQQITFPSQVDADPPSLSLCTHREVPQFRTGDVRWFKAASGLALAVFGMMLQPLLSRVRKAIVADLLHVSVERRPQASTLILRLMDEHPGPLSIPVMALCRHL